MTMTVGVIGLGRMGLPMAQNIADDGFDVQGYDIDQDRVAELEATGGTGVETPAELGANCGVVLVVVQNAEQTREVIFGSDGLCDGVHEETAVVVSATVSPEAVRDIDAQTPDQITLFDAPLCRGDDAAQEGSLLVLAGGPSEAFGPVREVFEATARAEDVHHFGPLGLGEVAKTANNVLLWSGLVADVEVFELCETYGMDIDALTDALEKSSGTNWGVNNWTERYPREIPWAHKDMRIALEMAETQGITMPSAGLLREEVRELQAAWEGQ